MHEFVFWALKMFLDTILNHSVKHFLLNLIESDRLTTGWPIPESSISQELFMIKTSNLKHIKEKRKALMTEYHSFLHLTYWPTFPDFTFMCKAIFSLVWNISQINTPE